MYFKYVFQICNLTMYFKYVLMVVLGYSNAYPYGLIDFHHIFLVASADFIPDSFSVDGPDLLQQ